MTHFAYTELRPCPSDPGEVTHVWPIFALLGLGRSDRLAIRDSRRPVEDAGVAQRAAERLAVAVGALLRGERETCHGSEGAVAELPGFIRARTARLRGRSSAGGDDVVDQVFLERSQERPSQSRSALGIKVSECVSLAEERPPERREGEALDAPAVGRPLRHDHVYGRQIRDSMRCWDHRARGTQVVDPLLGSNLTQQRRPPELRHR